MAPQLTLYTAKRTQTELALEESKLQYTRFEIDLQNKPEWYAPQVNPASKVPAIAYGGPVVSPDQPSPESEKLAESLVLLEFIADISGKLLPSDAVLRAKTRFFIDAVSNNVQSAFGAVIVRGEPAEKLLTAIEKVQSLLPAEGFAVGPEFTIADAALVPFLARIEVALGNDFGAFEEGTGPKTLEVLDTDAKFARYRKYFSDIKARESYQKTFDPKPQFRASISAVRGQFGSLIFISAMPLRIALSGEEIRSTARAALAVLKNQNLSACLVGGAACAIYGMTSRTPNIQGIDLRPYQDVDIIVVTEMHPEKIKELLVTHDNRFYLMPSINPQNSYKVLWFKVSYRRGCKVDILIPGILSIPKIPAKEIFFIQPFQDLPVVPFLVLLMTKLKAWADHGADARLHMQAKVGVDEGDISMLLDLGVKTYHAHLSKNTWLPESFVEESKRRVSEYTEKWPGTTRSWRAMGF
ncbi:hypothetical protein DXG01_004620 [Tephrocybe rancida]|nr:hypothetical protein DXG01_004620 [Tephrocybe rancida]